MDQCLRMASVSALLLLRAVMRDRHEVDPNDLDGIHHGILAIWKDFV